MSHSLYDIYVIAVVKGLKALYRTASIEHVAVFPRALTTCERAQVIIIVKSQKVLAFNFCTMCATGDKKA